MKLFKLLILLLLSFNTVYAKELIVIGAEWCPYCVKQKQYMEDNPDIIKNFNLEYIDIDEHPELKNKLNIKVYPTSFIFENNKKIGELRGFTPYNFKEWLKKYE